MKKFFRGVLLLIIIFLITSGLAIAYIKNSRKPSHDRDWSLDQQILPYAEVEGTSVRVHNVRNFVYASTTSYTPHYYDKTYNLKKVKKVWYIVEPFSDFAGAAHTFLSFEFEDNTFVSISVEIRKEKGESFSAIKGLMNNYELMYVVADERDVIKLRTNYRKDQVYMYPVNTTKEKAGELFLSMINRVNEIHNKPEFYNSISNNCTTNIVHHANLITPGRVPFLSLKILLPANSDKLAYEIGLIDTTLPFEEAREKFHANARAEKFANDPQFSVKIRQ